jgi:hypothetical protein
VAPSRSSTASAQLAPTAPPPVIIPPTGRTPRPGGCTSAQASTRQLLERYFSLTQSNDVGAVLDCFARSYREHSDMESSAGRWANAGKVMSLKIELVDRVNGCDRYQAQWDLSPEDPFHPNPWSIFYSVGPETGVARIFDGGTGLTAPEYTTVFCR